MLLQRSAKEAGIEGGSLKNLQDITRPELFPDYLWHSEGHRGHLPDVSTSSLSMKPPTSSTAAAKRSVSTVFLINKSREFHQRFQNSCFYVQPTVEADVVRYGKRQRSSVTMEDHASIHILEQIGKTADPRYVPPELLKVSDVSFLNEMGLIEEGILSNHRSLEELAAAERKQQQHRAAGEDGREGGTGDDGNFSDFADPEEDEEEDVDYTTNYYASEDESDAEDGGGDEAVF